MKLFVQNFIAVAVRQHLQYSFIYIYYENRTQGTHTQLKNKS